MPLHLRNLIAILAISGAVLWFARRLACAGAIAPEDYKRRSQVWLTLTLLVFLAHNYWIYVLFSVPLLYFAAKKDSNPLALLLFVAFAVPPFRAHVPGIGGLEALIDLDHLRWLSIAILLPQFMARRGATAVPFGRTAIDLAFVSYIVLWLILQSLSTSVTNVARIAVQMFLDMFLPYYVVSRGLRDLRAFRDALMSLVIAGLILSAAAAFEVARYWLLYKGLEEVLGLTNWGFGNYLRRESGGVLRAIVTAGHPIALGYLITVCMAMLVFLRPSIPTERLNLIAWGALGVGVIAAMSRGPWVGASAMLFCLLVTGPKVASKLLRVFLALLVVVPVGLSTRQGQAVLDYLPWVGNVASDSVDFRERLFDVSMNVLMHFPFFGALDFKSHPDMETMRGNDGIIDMVNAYMSVALSSGFVGLTLFLLPIVMVVVGIALALHRIRDPYNEAHRLGRSLLAAIVGILVTLGTAATVLAIHYVLVIVVGLGAGYLLMVRSTALVSSRPRAPDGRMGDPNSASRPARGREPEFEREMGA